MPDKVEQLVRSGYARFSAGERAPTLEFWHADGIYVTSADDPDPGTLRGIEAVTKQFRRWVEAYPDLTYEPLEVRTNGDRAFVWVRMSGHGGGSKVPVEMELAHVWTVEDGKIRRIEEYFDRAPGLKAAGLSESDAPATSQQAVNLACCAIEAWNEGGPEQAKQYWAEDYEFHDSPTMPDPKLVRGRDAVAKHLASFAPLVGGMRLVIKEALPCGDDEVVLLMEMELHGAQSGVDISGPFAQVAQVADGKVRRTRAFLNWAEALEAAGLPGRDAHS